MRDYFENITFDINERHALNAQYVQSYTNLFAQFDGNIVPSVSLLALLADVSSDVTFDSSVSEADQRLLIGGHYFGSDANFKLLATKQETALTISASLPLANYADPIREEISPCFISSRTRKRISMRKAITPFSTGRQFVFQTLRNIRFMRTGSIFVKK